MSLRKVFDQAVNWIRRLMSVIQAWAKPSAPTWEPEDKGSIVSSQTGQYPSRRQPLGPRDLEEEWESRVSANLRPVITESSLSDSPVAPIVRKPEPSGSDLVDFQPRDGPVAVDSDKEVPLGDQLSQEGPPAFDVSTAIDRQITRVTQTIAEVGTLPARSDLPEIELGEIVPDEKEPEIVPDVEGAEQAETEEQEAPPLVWPPESIHTKPPRQRSPSAPRPPVERRVRAVLTPRFDLSQHPRISREELDEFLQKAEQGDLTSMPGLTARRLDALLMEVFKDAELIGELPISEQAFMQIARLLRYTFVSGGSLNISEIWPALFVTSMVFCARYSREDARNFWTPYAQLVWRLPVASQSFQRQCREHFELCRKFLEKQYGLRFPLIAEREGSVVRPVFYHAVIPFYLQDDFARWLTAHVDELCDYRADSLLSILRDDPSLRRMPPSLQRFILQEDTADTAAELIMHLAEAAKLYQQGEEVTALLFNPIQRALWAEIQKALEEKSETGETVRRTPPPRLTWIWSLSEAELQLRLTNLYIDDPRHAPTLCVWTARDETNLAGSKAAVPLNPFKSHDKRWFVDEVMLTGGPLDGQVSVLSEGVEGEKAIVLYQVDVPPLPKESTLFFRVSPQRDWAAWRDNRRIADGDWLISMAEGVELLGENGQELVPLESRYVPHVLREWCGHARAARYELQLPVSVLQDGREILRLERNLDEIGQPWLDGPHMESGLSARVPAVFTALPIALHVPFMEAKRLRHVTLTIRSDRTRSVFNLDELQTQGHVTREVSGECVIVLDDLLAHKPGLYSINLRRNLKALMDEPIQFAFLPGIKIRPPDSNQLYSPVNHPQARIEGVSEGQVIVEPNQAICKPYEKGVLIEWHDLRTPECSLHLDVDGQAIPLAWPIRRIFACVEGLDVHGRLQARHRDKAVISIRGEPYQRLSWRIVNDGQQRDFQLNARGQWDCKLSQDPLIDMIEQCPHTQVVVNLKARDSEWRLFEYVRKPDFALQHINVPVEVPTKVPRETSGRKRVAPEWQVADTDDQVLEIPPFEWCLVPAGPFFMGGDPEAHRAWSGGEFDLPYDFWIAKYPVTVEQYAVFVKAGGYNEYEYWVSEGWGWKATRTEPKYWEDPRYHRLNHPVVGVTWYEAWAFAKWLNEQPGVKPPEAPYYYVVRLARECEWEKAARCPDGRKYPWGDEWDPTRLNWKRSGSGGTSSVHKYPKGANPNHGACDLAGNVWEWCLTIWQDRYQSPEAEKNGVMWGKESRCVRGGGWTSVGSAAFRAASRCKLEPRRQRKDLGFRVVVSKRLE